MHARRTTRASTRLAGAARAKLVLAGLILTSLLAAWQVVTPSDAFHGNLLNRVNAVWYDWRFQLLPPERDAAVPIVIVDVDEATQQREGRWPWDRQKVADLVRQLEHHDAALIGFDVVFSEPSLNPIRQILDQASLPKVVEQALDPLANMFDSDRELAQALSDRTVLGYFFHDDGGSAGSLPLPFLELPADEAARLSLLTMPDYTASLPILGDHALASGFVVAVPDADGIVRRVPLVMRHDTGVYASLSLELARLALGVPWVRLQQQSHDDRQLITGVRLGNRLSVPLDEHGSMLVPYRGRAKSFPTISATQVLQGDAPSDALEQLQGAIVLVGTSALGLGDLRTTPLQTAFPGVEVHANVLDTILTAALQQTGQKGATDAQGITALQASPFYHRPDWEPGASFALLVIMGVLMAWVLPGRTPLGMFLIAGCGALFMVGINLLLWQMLHLALPVALPVLVIVAMGGMNIAAGLVIATRQRRTIQSLFGEYVPADHVAQMLAHPDQVSMEGEQRHMTVLFADVRGFTALSETLSPAELKSLLNRYLSAVTEVIFQHHGTIDKYVGDLVMAFWNAPLDDADHATHAVQAALAMQERMKTLRETFRAEGLPELHIGIGINTGMMNVGDMGSRYRRAYTVLGDAVNVGSRLEGLTAVYGVPILVSDTTREQAAGFMWRRVDIVRVKGRTQALTVSQPLPHGEDPAPRNEPSTQVKR